MEKCDIGKSLNIHCHKTGFSRKQGFVQFKDLPCEKQEEIIWRANLKEKYSSIRIICCYHEQFYGKYFERKITKCCNPFGTHKESKKIAIKGNIKISIDMANYLQKNNVYVTPGSKFCSKCYKKAIETDEDLNSQEEWESKSEKKIKLDTTIELLGISPVKLKSLSKHSKLPVAKQKFENTIDRGAKMVSLAYNIKETFLTTEIKSPILNNNINNDHDLDILMYEIKNKISETDSYCHKVQMLTLAPKSWKRKKISSYFEVSEYLVRTARKVKNENGILSLPGKKTGNPLSPETVNLVINFYQSDEFSRMMPGKKDYVSIKKNQHVQKRLLLLNLNELHVAFKKDYPNVKVSLSKFCTLKPKWCITTNTSGTHNVCVCIHHQNTKFLIDAIRWNKSYKDFMALIVCSLENAE
ncbi:uncharacterized protein LOC136079843 [Hydra vulgaris]|uniref:uncharacterized protein LOC136079843 n=1 Tax=Hydra vulgaris TaxID=6087 RepID=UPI0032EA1C10